MEVAMKTGCLIQSRYGDAWSASPAIDYKTTGGVPPATFTVNLRDGSAETVLLAATLSFNEDWLSHPVTTQWYRVSQSRHWPYGYRRMVSGVPPRYPWAWRPTTVKWRQSSQSNRHSTIGTRQTQYYEALPSSANVQSLLTSSFADDANASWHSVCRVPELGMTVGLWKLSSLDDRRPPWYRPQFSHFSDEVNSAELLSMFQVAWSAHLSVAQFTETPTTSSTFLWYRSPRDVQGPYAPQGSRKLPKWSRCSKSVPQTLIRTSEIRYSRSIGEVNSKRVTSSLLRKWTRLTTHACEVEALTFEVTDNFGSNGVLPCGAYGPSFVSLEWRPREPTM